MTFLATHFYMIMGINKNDNKKRRSNFEFSCIQAMLFILLGKFLSFLL